MIDVTFLLLIFFLICSTMNQMDSVSLPPAYLGTAVNERNATVITIDGNGVDSVVYLGSSTSGTPLSADKETQETEIAKAIEQGLLNGKEQVVIRASGEIFQAEVNRIELVAASVPGIHAIHLAVREMR